MKRSGEGEENRHIWDRLGIEPTKELPLIKAAYARQTKVYHPEEFPEAFRALHQAYRQALAWAETGADQEGAGPQQDRTGSGFKTPVNPLDAVVDSVFQASRQSAREQQRLVLEEMNRLMNPVQFPKGEGIAGAAENEKAADAAAWKDLIKSPAFQTCLREPAVAGLLVAWAGEGKIQSPAVIRELYYLYGFYQPRWEDWELEIQELYQCLHPLFLQMVRFYYPAGGACRPKKSKMVWYLIWYFFGIGFSFMSSHFWGVLHMAWLWSESLGRVLPYLIDEKAVWTRTEKWMAIVMVFLACLSAGNMVWLYWP